MTAGPDAAIRYLVDPETAPAAQRRRLDFVQKLNGRLLQKVETDARWKA